MYYFTHPTRDNISTVAKHPHHVNYVWVLIGREGETGGEGGGALYSRTGADLSLVVAFLRLTPRRIEDSMLPSCSSGPSSSCSARVSDWLTKLGVSCVGDGEASVRTSWSSLQNGVGTVGVLTGMTGVLMGIGPWTLGPRHRLGFEVGARRMVATPGVMLKGPQGEGRLGGKVLRYEWLTSVLWISGVGPSQSCDSPSWSPPPGKHS